MAKSSGEQPAGVVPSVVREVLPLPGRPLDAGVRAFFEPRFGRDFSEVRVHTDELAARAADAVDASAFTVGRSIWFGRDMYQPGAASGRRLLAHELAHTIQQRGRPTAQRMPRLGGSGDAAEAAADRLADAVMAGTPVPNAGSGSGDLVIRRAPKVSPVPGNPSQRVVDMDDGSKFRVTRTVGLDSHTTEGEEPGPKLTPQIDQNNIWLQVEWCSKSGKGDIHTEVKVGDDLPAAAQAALRKVGDAIRSGTDPAEAIRNAELKPFASVSITQSERFTAELRGGPTIQLGTGKVTGGQGELTLNVGPAKIDLQLGVGEPPPGPSHRTGPNVTVGGQIEVPLDPPPKVVCKRTNVIPKISYQCEKIVPEHKIPVSVPHRETHSFYFEWSKPEFARSGRTAALDAQSKADVKRLLDAGYRIENIRGRASPEGPKPPGPGFRGNDLLSQARAKAVEDWVTKVGLVGAATRPSSFTEDYRRSGESELYGASPEGTELKGKELAEASVKAFETEPAEQARRTRDVMEELEKKKTPERQTDTVFPLLRRAEIDLVRIDPGEKVVPESTTLVRACPAEVIRAVADDFEPIKRR